MSLVPLIYWIEVKSASSSVLSKLNTLSSHLWSITPVEFWWDAIYSLAVLSYIFSSLMIVLESVSVSFCKVTSSFDEHLVWMLILEMFEFPITLSLFYVFRSFYSLLLTCEVTLVHILFLDLGKTFRLCFCLDGVKSMTIYFTFFNSPSVESK